MVIKRIKQKVSLVEYVVMLLLVPKTEYGSTIYFKNLIDLVFQSHSLI